MTEEQIAAKKKYAGENHPLVSQQVTAWPSQVSATPSQDGKPYQPLFAKGYNDLVLRSYDELPTWENYPGEFVLP